jgi:hypothetical protein
VPVSRANAAAVNVKVRITVAVAAAAAASAIATQRTGEEDACRTCTSKGAVCRVPRDPKRIALPDVAHG